MPTPVVSHPPAFVNLQPSAVTVYDDRRRSVTVSPWNHRNSHAGDGVTFVVYGDHYKQFVSGAGPLYPFPGDPAVLRLPGRAQGHGVDTVIPAKAAQQRTPPKDDTAIPASGDARGRILALIREELRAVGIASPSALLQASSAQLFQAPHINEGNIKFVREAAAEMFPNKGAGAATPPAEPGTSEGAGDGEPAGSEGEGEALTKYSRAAVAVMGRNDLLKTISAEGFEIPVTLKTEVLREKLLQGLGEYGQLTE
jgi:hypothetical protein